MPSTRSALIIGGGIAGPVADAALLKAGIQATVYEAYPGLSDGIGGALALGPNGLAALGLIGAADAVRGAAIPITRSVMSIRGRDRGQLPSLPDVEPRQVIDRGTLHRLLTHNAAAAGVRFEYGKRLVAVNEAAEGIEARFADGATASADVIVGADGVRSTVRGLIDPHGPPWPQYLRLTEARAGPASHWLLRDTYRSDKPGSLLAERTTIDTLQVTGALHIMPPVPQWYRGRMVLVGDAVHAPSNSTGQGASLAIESAIQLAWCLRDLGDPATAFAAYEQLRRPRVEGIAKRGAKLNRAKTPGPVAQAGAYAADVQVDQYREEHEY